MSVAVIAWMNNGMPQKLNIIRWMCCILKTSPNVQVQFLQLQTAETSSNRRMETTLARRSFTVVAVNLILPRDGSTSYSVGAGGSFPWCVAAGQLTFIWCRG